MMSEQSIIEKLDELFNHMQNKIFSFHMMDNVVNCGADLPDGITFDGDIFKRATDCLIAAKKEVDIRVFRYYVPVFRLVYLHVEDVESAMSYFYNFEEFTNTPEHIPALREIYPAQKFETELGLVITKVQKNEFNTDDQLCKELSFYLTIAPKPTIAHILRAAISNQTSLETFVKFLRTVPAFFRLRVPHVYHPERKELVIITLFRHSICTEYKHQTKKLEMIANIATKLTETQRNLHDAVFDASELIRDLIIDLMDRIKDNNYSILLTMLLIMLPPGKSDDVYWKINWIDGLGGVKVQDFLNAVYDLYKRDVPFKPDQKIIMTYRLLYDRLKADGYSMSDYEDKIYLDFFDKTIIKIVEKAEPLVEEKSENKDDKAESTYCDKPKELISELAVQSKDDTTEVTIPKPTENLSLESIETKELDKPLQLVSETPLKSENDKIAITTTKSTENLSLESNKTNKNVGAWRNKYRNRIQRTNRNFFDGSNKAEVMVEVKAGESDETISVVNDHD